jgi:hypothetical protein
MSKSKLHRQTAQSDVETLAEAIRVAYQFENSALRERDLGSNEYYFRTVEAFDELDGLPKDADGYLTASGKKELRNVAAGLRLLAEMFEQYAKGID